VRHSGPVTILKWCDKRSVTMVSIYHRADRQRGNQPEGPVAAYIGD